ncbi:hypothetical protein I0C86_33650 [Plantactinospora sp. S1510]|uniref:Uncharacterized protein n=1 Tax=Plantactinospora alkalitolerans TaxID=2789879 RepID=A0ABS0H5X4_9ACTN|nr:hypothetical protein [Plantactinospora alkalitolerans]MBF9133843.1 hypothetical protein [Plantactinospora alkalitolerans]
MDVTPSGRARGLGRRIRCGLGLHQHRLRSADEVADPAAEVKHRTRRVYAQDLPSGEPSTDVIARFDKPNCDCVQLCEDCGDTIWVSTEHDWDSPRWGDICRRCGEKWVGDEA